MGALLHSACNTVYVYTPVHRHTLFQPKHEPNPNSLLYDPDLESIHPHSECQGLGMAELAGSALKTTSSAKPGAVASACDPSTDEMKAGGSEVHIGSPRLA